MNLDDLESRREASRAQKEAEEQAERGGAKWCCSQCLSQSQICIRHRASTLIAASTAGLTLSLWCLHL